MLPGVERSMDFVHQRRREGEERDDCRRTGSLLKMCCRADGSRQLPVSDVRACAAARTMYQRSDYSLMAYLPVAALAVSYLTATTARVRLQWPRAAMESQRRVAQNQSLAAGWLAGASPAVQSTTGLRPAVLEVLPSLVQILSPAGLKLAAAHLMSPADREQMEALVHNLLDYGLTYRVGKQYGGLREGEALCPRLPQKAE